MLPSALRHNPSWLPAALNCNAEEEAVQQAEPVSRSPAAAADADLGAGEWKAAPPTWGVAWFVLLSLLVIVPNCQFAMLKYTSWDKRDHFGIGAWTTCSYAFEDDKAWAPVPDYNLCNTSALDACGKKDEIMDCTPGDEFSSTNGINSQYEKSWSNCREICGTTRWEAWCRELNCGGGEHNNQCQNVTEAVQGNYDVEYVTSAELAWSGGEICRDIEDLCPGMEGSFKVIGDFAAVGLVCTAIGLTSLLSFQFMKQERKNIMLLQVSLGGFCLAFIFIFISWVSLANIQGEKTTCIVEAESGTGAVKAHGRFIDIFRTGAYALPFLVGSWILLMIPMLFILVRIYTKQDTKSKQDAPEEISVDGPITQDNRQVEKDKEEDGIVNV
jgi:hypothetical protein